MRTRPSALIVLSSHGQLGDTGRATGFYMAEAAHPWQVFTDAGFSVTLVSVAGGRPPADGLDETDPVQRAFLADPDVSRQLADTPTPDQVDPTGFDAVLFAGGHGTMWDFRGDPRLSVLATGVDGAGGVVAALCHGPAALVDLTRPDGTPFVAGRRLTAFTNAEEAAAGLTDVVPFALQTALEQRGARHVAGPDFAANVVVDGRLVTGQNPASAAGTAEAVVAVVRARLASTG